MNAAAVRHDLDAWIVASAPRAVAFAASLLRDKSQAEDIVQDCYCRLLRRADVYDLPRDGNKLLFRAISNACINATTRKRQVLSLEGGPDGGAMQVADARAYSPEDEVVNRELERSIAEGLSTLPPMQRAALELKSLGHSQQEIADILEVTANYAGVLVHRARQELATYLAPILGEA